MSPNRKTFSNTLLIICAIVTLISVIYPQVIYFGMNNLYIQNKDYVGVFVQFLLYQFLHGGLLHLLSNALFIYIFGNQVESFMKRKKYVIFFLLNTIFVGISLIIFSPLNTTIGISGFAMAILGYYFITLKQINHPEYKSALLLLFINIGIGFTGNISLIGHLFGAIFGIIFYYGDKLFRKSR